MAKEMFNDAFDTENKLAYDLRVFYAIVIGRKMLKIEDAIERKDYSSWLRELELAFPIVYSRIDKDRKETKEDYNKLRGETLEKINKHSQAFLRKSYDAEGVAEVERALTIFQHFIYRILHISNQFGTETDIKGLN